MTGLRWAVLDAATITGRDVAHWVRQPAPVVVTLMFPVMTVVLFGYLLGGAIDVPGTANYFDYLLPGMFALTMAFGVEATMLAVSTDAAKGVTDRFRSIPMGSSAVVVGRCAADMLSSVAGLLVLVGCGLAVGWRWRDGVAAATAALGLLLLLRLALLWLGIYLGLISRDPGSVVAVQILVWPLGFLSSAFVSPETMPGVLRVIAEWNPLSATATAARELFGNPGWTGESWVAQHALLMAVVWPLVLIAVLAPLAVRRYRRLSR